MFTLKRHSPVWPFKAFHIITINFLSPQGTILDIYQRFWKHLLNKLKLGSTVAKDTTFSTLVCKTTHWHPLHPHPPPKEPLRVLRLLLFVIPSSTSVGPGYSLTVGSWREDHCTLRKLMLSLL